MASMTTKPCAKFEVGEQVKVHQGTTSCSREHKGKLGNVTKAVHSPWGETDSGRAHSKECGDWYYYVKVPGGTSQTCFWENELESMDYRTKRDLEKNTFQGFDVFPMYSADFGQLKCDDTVTNIEPGGIIRSTYSNLSKNVKSDAGELTLEKVQSMWNSIAGYGPNNKKNNTKNMDSESTGKFYKVIKDTPAWEKGAIIKFDGSESYKAVNTLFSREGAEPGYVEVRRVVEAQPEFFERVYQATEGGKTVYVTKEKAKELFTASTTVTA